MAAPAHAGVEGSPHDLIAQRYDVPKTGASLERCLLCHAAALVSGPGVSREVPPSLRGQYGPESLTCFSCHDGITLVAPEVDASLTAFHPAGHGLDLERYQPLQDPGAAVPDAGGDRLECTVCHNPHDNANRPFLRAPLNELCVQCHSPRVGAVTEGVNNTGNHSVGNDPAAAPRPEVPIQVRREFTVAFPASYPSQGGKGSAGTHWDLGGHLLKGATGGTACVTCHAVHGDESAPPAPALLTVDPVQDIADELCEGCHRGVRGDGGTSGAAPNPGGTSAGQTYHPCDDDVANGKGRLLDVTVPKGWPLGGSSPARLLCTTCHKAHGAEPGTALLRPPTGPVSFCAECHAQLPLENHHPTGQTEGPCAARVSPAAGGSVSLDCGRCHRAHNAGLGAADEREFVPILRAARRTDDLCVTCHPADNPSCGTVAEQTASHFLGDPGLPETYSDANPPIRITPWPESALTSLYGGPEGKSIICLSCHSFRKGALRSGDDGGTPFLLARAGNPEEWVEGEEGKYLCTGCHGLNPGTGAGDKGHTHPLMNADVARLGLPVNPPASATAGGRLNCDSCHRAHGAVTASGVYMMEAVRGANTDPRAIHPKIDFTPTCHLCHGAGKY